MAQPAAAQAALLPSQGEAAEMLNLKQAQTIVEATLNKGHESKMRPLTVAVLDARGCLVAYAMEAGGLLREQVAKEIGKIARPREIHVVPELPKTRSGKIMRRLLRDVAEGRELGDTSTLVDPSVFEAIKASK